MGAMPVPVVVPVPVVPVITVLGLGASVLVVLVLVVLVIVVLVLVALVPAGGRVAVTGWMACVSARAGRFGCSSVRRVGDRVVRARTVVAGRAVSLARQRAGTVGSRSVLDAHGCAGLAGTRRPAVRAVISRTSVGMRADSVSETIFIAFGPVFAGMLATLRRGRAEPDRSRWLSLPVTAARPRVGLAGVAWRPARRLRAALPGGARSPDKVAKC
jgi:hypothetical protein